MPSRILLLTASTGNGHIAASRAIAQEAEADGHFVRSVDMMECTPPVFRAWFRGGYETLVRRCPWFWGYLYKSSDRRRLSYAFQTALDWVFMGRVEKVIAEFRPDWVVCTHSVAQPRLGTLRRKYPFKMAIVVTDLHPHLMWLRGEPELYCVPNDWSERVLRERVGSSPRVVVTGIPIAREFQTIESGPCSYPPRVLLSAGGIGAGPIVEAAMALKRLPLEMELRVLCGSSKDTEQKLLSVPQSGCVKLTPRGLVPHAEMAREMSEAALFIGKPGGLTTFEALACGLPFVVLDPCMIPGQEERNAEFLEEVGAGIRVKKISDLPEAVAGLLSNPARLATMRDQALKNAHPTAAREVLNSLQLISKA